MTNEKSQKSVIQVDYILLDTQEKVLEMQLERLADFDYKKQEDTLLGMGYEILQSDVPTTSPSLLDTVTYHVYVREKISFIHADQPKEKNRPVDFHPKLTYPAGVGYDDLNKVLTREVEFIFEDGTEVAPSITEKLHFTRTAIVNHAQKTVTYLAWQANTDNQFFRNVQLPVLVGYQPEPEELKLEAVADIDDAVTNNKYTIKYLKQTQTAQIRLVDATSNKELANETFEGKTGDIIDYPYEDVIRRFVAKGYHLVENPFTQNPRFSAEEDLVDQFVIYFKPHEFEVHAADDIPAAGTPVYPDVDDSVLWPAGLQAKDLEKTITRTIHSVYEDGTQVSEPLKQVVTFERSAAVSLLSGSVFHTPWTIKDGIDYFDEFVPIFVEGFVPKPRLLSKITDITINSLDSDIQVVYTKKIQKVFIRFVDTSDQQRLLYQKKLVGKTGDALSYDPEKKLQEFIHNGYELVSSNFPETGHFGHDSEQEISYTFQLTPRIVTITPKTPKKAGNFIDEDKYPGLKWPEGLEEAALRRQVSRTVSYVYEDGSEAFPKTVDQVVFERKATVNLVTYEVLYSAWTDLNEQLQAREVPQLKGFITDRQQIDVIDRITVDSADFDVTVRYTRVESPDRLVIYDVTSNQIISNTITYSHTPAEIKDEILSKSLPFIELGYDFVSSSKEVKTSTNKDGARVSVLEVKQVEVEVTLETAKEAYHPIPEHVRLTWPQGLGKTDLTKTVSRSTYLVYDNGGTAGDSLVQEITFTRTALVNLVTGEVTYSEWTAPSSRLEEVAIPQIAGYTPSQTKIASEVITAEDVNKLIEVVYYATPDQVTITYLEKDSQEVIEKEVFVGSIGEGFHYTPTARLEQLGLRGYSISENATPDWIAFDGHKKEYTVVLEARFLEVHAGEPYLPNTVTNIEDYGLFMWPSGVDYHALHSLVSRTIHYQAGSDIRLSDSVTQSILFRRNAFINLATLEVSYTEWYADSSVFPEVVSPAFEGYQTKTEVIPELEAIPSLEDQNIDVVVTYVASPYNFVILVHDKDSNQILEKLTLTVLPGEQPSYTLDNLISYYDEQGYELIETEVAENNQQITLTVSPRRLTVTLDLVESDYQMVEPEVVAHLRKLPGLTVADLSRNISRTIHYRYSDGSEAAPSYSDSVEFTRKAFIDLVSNKVHYSEWHSYYPVFDEVLSPLLENFTPSNEVSASIEQVTEDSLNITEVIYYSRNIQQVVMNYVNKTTGDVIYTEPVATADDKLIPENIQPEKVSQTTVKKSTPSPKVNKKEKPEASAEKSDKLLSERLFVQFIERDSKEKVKSFELPKNRLNEFVSRVHAELSTFESKCYTVSNRAEIEKRLGHHDNLEHLTVFLVSTKKDQHPNADKQAKKKRFFDFLFDNKK